MGSDGPLNNLSSGYGARAAYCAGPYTFETVTDKISSIVLTRGTTPGWVFGFLIAFAALMLLNLVVTMLMIKGVGIWGIRIPTGWGFAIVNFVWWIGIGHAGTLISAILLLLHQKWRTSIQPLCRGQRRFLRSCARACFRCCTWAVPGYFST